METLTNLFVAFLPLFFATAAALFLWWIGYGSPRWNAFANHQSNVSVWFGLGQLFLWNPGETFVFLRNKRVSAVGDANGGLRTVFPLRGEEARGPISLKTELLTWPDVKVLTREAQPLTVKLAVWWKIVDPAQYVFRIASEVHHSPDAPLDVDGKANISGPDGSVIAKIHSAAIRWIQALTEAAVRNRVNGLGMSEVISAQAMQFLQIEGNPAPQQATQNGFESLIQGVQDNVSAKTQEYGIQLERTEVQSVTLPDDMQQAIDDTRKAFLAPIRSEKEAEARKIALQKLADILGPETVGLNELLKNFQGSNFGFVPPFLQSLLGMVDKSTSKITHQEKQPAIALEPKQQITDQTSIFCAQCGTKSQLDQKFCTNCGSKLLDVTPKEPDTATDS